MPGYKDELQGDDEEQTLELAVKLMMKINPKLTPAGRAKRELDRLRRDNAFGDNPKGGAARRGAPGGGRSRGGRYNREDAGGGGGRERAQRGGREKYGKW